MRSQIVGADTLSYPTMEGPPQVILAVLTRDGTGRYACYAGIVRDGGYDKLPDDERMAAVQRKREWVKANGRKLMWHEAIRFFPSIQAGDYRT